MPKLRTPPPNPPPPPPLPQARSKLLHLLVRPSLSSSSAAAAASTRPPAAAVGRVEGGGGVDAPPNGSSSRWRGSAFPYLSVLLYVDAAAAIDVLSVAMDSPEAVFRGTGETSPVSSDSPTAFEASRNTPSGGQSYSRDSSSAAGREKAGRPAAGGQPDRKALGGGVWGRRLGRGRARTAVEGEGEARGGGDWRSGGAGWRVVGGADAEDVCPSRRTIIEVSDSRTCVGYMD